MHLDSEGIFEIVSGFLKLNLAFEIFPSWWFPSTHLKNISQIGSFPQGSGQTCEKIETTT